MNDFDLEKPFLEIINNLLSPYKKTKIKKH